MTNALLRSAIVCLLLAAIAPFASTAEAQIINLDPTPQLPDLTGPTAAAELAGDLEAEAGQLITARDAAGRIGRAAQDAKVTYRLIAVELLRRADREGEPASLAVVAAVRLASARDDLDGLLTSAGARLESIAPSTAEDDQRKVVRTLELWRQFNERSLELLRRSNFASAAEIDQAVAIALAPLAESLQIDGHAACWPRLAGPADTAGDLDLDQLKAQVTSARVDEGVREALLEIIDYLTRGGSFPELRPAIAAYQRAVRQSIDFAATIDRATFLSPESLAASKIRLAEAVAMFRDVRTRDVGLRRLDRLDASRSVLESLISLNAAARLGADGDTMKACIAALQSADDAIANEPESAAAIERLNLLREIIDRFIAWREIQGERLRGDLRAAQRDLQKSYESTEASLLKELTAIASQPSALSEPARATLITGHATALEDLRRLSRLSLWVDSIGGIRPSAMNGFSNQVRKLSQWLLDTNKRPDALRAMDQFESQLNLFLPVPFETELRQSDPVAVVAAGNRHAELIKQIEAARGQWADAWGRGENVAAAANRMLLLYRLTQSLKDLAPLVEVTGATNLAATLNRWGAWQLSQRVMAPSIDTIPARLKLAVESAISKDDGQLNRELNSLDRDLPLAKLSGRLAQKLGPQLPAPSSSAPALAVLLTPMPSDAFLGRKRESLGRLCRYAMELDFARRTGRLERVEPLHRYVTAQADEMLLELGDRRTAIPTLPDFDSPQNPDRPRPMR